MGLVDRDNSLVVARQVVAIGCPAEGRAGLLVGQPISC